MIAVTEVAAWLATLAPECQHVAISEGGLDLVAVTPEGQYMGAYIEVGLAPLDDEAFELIDEHTEAGHLGGEEPRQ